MKIKHIIVLGFAIAALFVMGTHSGNGPMLGGLDIAIFRWINQDMQNPTLDFMASTASDIGSKDTDVIIYILISASITLLVAFLQGNRTFAISVILLLIALFISSAIVDPLKTVFGISRPYVYLKDVHAYISGSWVDMINPLDLRDSFPSGHAAITFTTLGIFWIYKKIRMPLFVILCILMFLIIYVGQHYASDIIAGGFIGFMIGYLVQRTYSRMFQT